MTFGFRNGTRGVLLLEICRMKPVRQGIIFPVRQKSRSAFRAIAEKHAVFHHRKKSVFMLHTAFDRARQANIMLTISSVFSSGVRMMMRIYGLKQPSRARGTTKK